jgi:hypothetical protein
MPATVTVNTKGRIPSLEARLAVYRARRGWDPQSAPSGSCPSTTVELDITTGAEGSGSVRNRTIVKLLPGTARPQNMLTNPWSQWDGGAERHASRGRPYCAGKDPAQRERETRYCRGPGFSLSLHPIDENGRGPYWDAGVRSNMAGGTDTEGSKLHLHERRPETANS